MKPDRPLRRHSRLAPLLFGLLALAAAATAALAGDPGGAPPAPATPAGTFSGTAEVKLVEIPVQVTRHGEPVRGLTAADFQVWAGKEPQRIVGMDVVDVSQIEPDNGVGTIPKDVPSAARRHFLFLFDLSQSTPTSLARAQQAALTILDDLNVVDLAAVATYSPARGPRVLLAFTPDRSQVRLALQTLGSTEMVETRTDWLGLNLGEAKLALEQAFKRPGNEPGGGRVAGGGGGGDTVGVARARELLETFKDLQPLEEGATTGAARDRAKSFTRGMADLANLLGAVSGRKHVLLLSEGFDADLAVGKAGREAPHEDTPSESYQTIYRTDSEVKFGNSGLQREMQQLVEAMRRADCTIHSVDIAGLEGGGRDIAEVATEVRHTGKGEDSLFYLAKETGGSFHRGTNDLAGALGGVLRATAVTYVLSVQPSEKAAGKDGYVPLRVEVRGGGDVSARAGYYTSPPAGAQAQLQERLRIGAEVVEGKAGGAIHTAVAGVPAAPGKGALAVVAVDGATLLGNAPEDIVSGDVTVYAFASDGSIAAMARQLVGLDLRVVRDRLRATGFELFAPLDLKPGTYRLRALVRNTLTGAYGIATGGITVPPAGSPTPMSAVFAQPPGQAWMLVRNDETALNYPFAAGGTQITPALAPRLRGGESATIWMRGAGAQPVAARVTALDGSAAAEAKLALAQGSEDVPTGAALLASVQLPTLSPGSYQLELRAGADRMVALPFTVAAAP